MKTKINRHLAKELKHGAWEDMRAQSAQFQPMQTAGTHNLIERIYREGGQFQWAREVLVNALEADATRVEFGIEWQAVHNKGVYRRIIADNGKGMNPEQLVAFFNTFGGGGKPIGGMHENFGVGSKTSLLPWNQYGMVVISWVDGDASMIWVHRDKESGEYGLKVERCKGPDGAMRLEAVYDPYNDDDHGCSWMDVKPEWIDGHGTVIILLGNSPDADTVTGDPSRAEDSIKGLSSYLNRRMWQFKEGVEVYVDELRTSDSAQWPRTEEAAHGLAQPGQDRRTNMRRISGARNFIEYKTERFNRGQLKANGTVRISGGIEIDWFLWKGERPAVSAYAAESGFIGVLYKNELFDITNHHSTYRSFGVSEQGVRSRLWLIVRPFIDKEGKCGVYPKSDRNSLLIKGGTQAGGPLPISDWAAEFADDMPEEIVFALREARHGLSGTITDDEWRDRLAEKFGSRWRIAKLRMMKNGKIASTSMDGEDKPVRVSKRSAGQSGGKSGSTRAAQKTAKQRSGLPRGAESANQFLTEGGIPTYVTVNANEVGEGMLAGWQPKHPDHPEGVVLLNIEHPVLRSVIEFWQSQYADHHAEGIEQDIVEVYGQVAVSKIAHSEHLKGIIQAKMVNDQLRSDAALTMALLGLMAEDHLISTRINGKYKRRRHSLLEGESRVTLRARVNPRGKRKVRGKSAAK